MIKVNNDSVQTQRLARNMNEHCMKNWMIIEFDNNNFKIKWVRKNQMLISNQRKQDNNCNSFYKEMI